MTCSLTRSGGALPYQNRFSKPQGQQWVATCVNDRQVYQGMPPVHTRFAAFPLPPGGCWSRRGGTCHVDGPRLRPAGAGAERDAPEPTVWRRGWPRGAGLKTAGAVATPSPLPASVIESPHEGRIRPAELRVTGWRPDGSHPGVGAVTCSPERPSSSMVAASIPAGSAGGGSSYPSVPDLTLVVRDLRRVVGL